MAHNQSIRIRPIVLKADHDAYTALQSMGGYAPANPDYAKAKAAERFNTMLAAQDAEVHAANALAAARDAVSAAEWDFHNFMLEVKTQVAAQFGQNSDEIHAMGLKKKSERKKPVRKVKAAE